MFIIFNAAGWGLLFVGWLQTIDTSGFFLLLVLGLMCLVRLRLMNGKIKWIIIVDLFVVLVFLFASDASTAQFAVGFVLFQGMYFGFFALAGLFILLVAFLDVISLFVIASAMTVGWVLHFWNKEYANRLLQRDGFVSKIHGMEQLQTNLTDTLARVEHMSILAERARISADIHDNAGHEIIASYISLQTVRKIMDTNPEKALDLFDKAMVRLNAGMGKMRDTVHNISTVTFMGVDRMRDICLNFAEVPVTFQSTGDVSVITVSVWQVLESLLKESLTNAIKHAKPTYIRVELDATRHLIRLQIQNDGITQKETAAGSGLRNLRYRVVNVGGNLSTDKSDVYKLVCVIPIKEASCES